VLLLTSYIVDGFAAAGTVLGSRLGDAKADNPQSLKCESASTAHLYTVRCSALLAVQRTRLVRCAPSVSHCHAAL
jgi:hypothetical protein